MKEDSLYVFLPLHFHHSDFCVICLYLSITVANFVAISYGNFCFSLGQTSSNPKFYQVFLVWEGI